VGALGAFGVLVGAFLGPPLVPIITPILIPFDFLEPFPTFGALGAFGAFGAVDAFLDFGTFGAFGALGAVGDLRPLDLLVGPASLDAFFNACKRATRPWIREWNNWSLCIHTK
jgi:hypothetical protein